MSTILDALRKVETERESPGGRMLHVPAPPTEIRRDRRSIPVTAIIASAVVAFAGGGMLSWWLGEAPRVEVATLPAAAPPAIPVPRPPVRARKAPPAAPVAEPAADAAAPADTAPAPAPQVAAANPPAESAPPAASTAVAPMNKAAAAPAPPIAAAPVQAAPPVVPPVANAAAGAKGEVTGRLAPDKALAALDKQESALEPSPFAAARATQPAPGAIAPAEPGKRIAALAKPSAPAAPPAEEKLAALTPPPLPEPAAPALETTPPLPEAEPEAPAEPLFDTGRSPPGAPKVALSFLQWSADPAKRFAFISIDGAPSQRVHEGEVAGGMTVAAITQNGVQFKREGQTFVIRPRH